MILLDRALRVIGRVDDHAHAALAVRALAAENPDGLGVVDENVVDRRSLFLASDGNEARDETRTLRSSQARILALTRSVERRFCDRVVL